MLLKRITSLRDRLRKSEHEVADVIAGMPTL
jgi:DNA-binding MurR/RpiR family transcriptional regulator